MISGYIVEWVERSADSSSEMTKGGRVMWPELVLYSESQLT